jgi:hypothetical protein
VKRERRRDSRIHIDWVAVVRDNTGSNSVAELEDISASGAFIRCEKPLWPKERFKLQVVVPNRHPLSSNAEVAWLHVCCDDNELPPCGMGVRFTRIPRADRQFIHDLIAKNL